FDGKADEGFFIGYSTNSKAFKVFNSRTRIVEENLHVQFSENTPNIAGSGPNWLFDIDALTKSMNYKPVVAGNQSNGSAGTKACDNVGKARVETVPGEDYILLPLWTQDPAFSSSSKDSPDAEFKPSGEEEKKDAEDPRNEDSNPTKGKDSEVPSTKEAKINQEEGCATTTTVDEFTLAQTLLEIKAAKPKAVTTTATTTITAVSRPKARGVVVQEPNQILIDEEIAQRLQEELQAELEEEERLTRQKEQDANIAEWDNVQAIMDADYELATRLQAQEQEEMTIKRVKRF
ncbi:hypothetical protein Tco_0138465, partial [Tanacetum coccineum]